MAISLVNSTVSVENQEGLELAFRGFDKESCGKVNSEEFKKAMMTLGDILQENEVFSMFFRVFLI